MPSSLFGVAPLTLLRFMFCLFLFVCLCFASLSSLCEASAFCLRLGNMHEKWETLNALKVEDGDDIDLPTLCDHRRQFRYYL